MRRFFAISLSLLLVFSMMGTSYANMYTYEALENNMKPLDANVVVYSEEFPDAYFEQEYMDLSEVEITIEDGLLQCTSNESGIRSAIEILNNDESRLKEAVENISLGRELIGVVTATAHVEEIYSETEDGYICTESRLLSEEEVNNSGTCKDEIEVFANSLAGMDSANKYLLTITLNVYTSTTGNERYVLEGIARWDFGAPTAKERPASGEDYISFIWGGGFDSANKGNVVVKANPSNTTTNSLLTPTPADYVPSAVTVWSFPEYKYHWNYGNVYAEKVTSEITLKKTTLTGNGNTTAAVFKYIHTFTSTQGSISVNLSGSATTSTAISGQVALTGVNDQWSIVAAVTGLNY